MNTNRLLPRFASASVERALRVMPVTVLTGARQTGKSTLARMNPIGTDRSYFTLDDYGVLEQAQREPDALVARAVQITLDEVQRVPHVLLAIKRLVDEDRVAGRFLLTGSANLLLMKEVGETLAGRASYLTLWPMTRREQRGLARAWSVDRACRCASYCMAGCAARGASRSRAVDGPCSTRRLSRPSP